MRRIYLLSGIFWCLIFILSCTSQNAHSPQIHFISPDHDIELEISQELNIEIDILDDQLVKDYKFWMESKSGFKYFQDQRPVHKTEYKILYTFNLSNNIGSNFSIHLEVWDDEDNRTYKSMNVSMR